MQHQHGLRVARAVGHFFNPEFRGIGEFLRWNRLRQMHADSILRFGFWFVRALRLPGARYSGQDERQRRFSGQSHDGSPPSGRLPAHNSLCFPGRTPSDAVRRQLVKLACRLVGSRRSHIAPDTPTSAVYLTLFALQLSARTVVATESTTACARGTRPTSRIAPSGCALVASKSLL